MAPVESVSGDAGMERVVTEPSSGRRVGSIGTAVDVPLEGLRLDPENPRLPPEMRGRSDEVELALYIDANYDPLRVARSIAAHGYFPSEPLIVLDQGDGEYVVVEGNRRLVALRGLADAGLRARFEEPEEWAELASVAQLSPTYPGIVALTRADVAPIIGYRHISGIEPWDPLAKARFVASLIDDPEAPVTFSEAASIVGEEVSDVRALYRNASIVNQASTEFGLDTGRMETEFGVFTRAMNSQALRDYIGAPAPRDVASGRDPLPSDRRAAMADLITWLFGGPDGSGKAIAESRDITRLGRVVQSPDALVVLRETGSLQDADDAAGGPLARLTSRLTQARNALRAALADIDRFSHEDEVRDLVSECEHLISELRERS